MVFKIPEQRLPKHILLTRNDAWALRELIKPIAFPRDTEIDIAVQTNAFLHVLYNALLHIELEGRGEWNLPVTETMIHVINREVKSQAWSGADGILTQSWLALDEIERGSVWELPSTETVVLLSEEEANAIRDDGSPAASIGFDEARDAGGVELPSIDSSKGVH